MEWNACNIESHMHKPAVSRQYLSSLKYSNKWQKNTFNINKLRLVSNPSIPFLLQEPRPAWMDQHTILLIAIRFYHLQPVGHQPVLYPRLVAGQVFDRQILKYTTISSRAHPQRQVLQRHHYKT